MRLMIVLLAITFLQCKSKQEKITPKTPTVDVIIPVDSLPLIKALKFRQQKADYFLKIMKRNQAKCKTTGNEIYCNRVDRYYDSVMRYTDLTTLERDVNLNTTK